MPEITRLTVQLSLIVTPPSDRVRDCFNLEQRVAHLEHALETVRELSLFWPAEREPNDGFVNFEAKQIEAIREVGRASSELMLALAEAKSRRELPDRFEAGGTEYRLAPPERRSLNTWFGTIRYGRSYARPVEGGAGWFPLDVELGLLSDRISPSLLATSTRLATRVSFGEARAILEWFVPQPPSTEVLEQAVLGFGHHTATWFESVPPPDDDGEVLVVLIDGKCVPTARKEELEKTAWSSEGQDDGAFAPSSRTGGPEGGRSSSTQEEG